MPSRPLFPLLCLLAAGAACAAEPTPGDIARQLLEQVPATRPLLFGELHGTVEAPAFVAEVARQAADAGPVLVALEIHADEQSRIDAFLASSGDAEARAALLAGRFWHKEPHDGRDSIAMAALFDALQALRAADKDVRVLAFDCPLRGKETRDAAMARCIDAGIDAAPDARILVLTGNYHARVAIGAPWDPAFEFTGHALRHRKPVAIDLSAARGTAWICTPDCGRFTLSDRGTNEAMWLRMDESRRADGYDGEVRFPAFEASPPTIGGHADVGPG